MHPRQIQCCQVRRFDDLATPDHGFKLVEINEGLVGYLLILIALVCDMLDISCQKNSQWKLADTVGLIKCT